MEFIQFTSRRNLGVLALGLALLHPQAQSAPSGLAAAMANNAFGIKLFNAVKEKTAKGNKVVSPISGYLALSMLYNGAQGASAEELSQGLGVPGMTIEDLNGANEDLIRRLVPTENFKLTFANSIWVDDAFQIDPNFEKGVLASYTAEIQKLKLEGTDAASKINAWVHRNTQKKIKQIVPDTLPANTVLVLSNATYFEAEWSDKFKKDRSFPDPFGPSQEKVLMMHQEKDFKTLPADDSGIRAIELPYGKGEVSMIVVLPTKSTPEEFAASLTSATWRRLTTKLQKQPKFHVNLALPKLKFGYGANLIPPMSEAMGVPSIFTGAAELSGLGTSALGHLLVNTLNQKSFLEVDEEGTKATAATTGSVGAGIANDFIINQPYFFAIQENATGAILFLGTVNLPEIAE